MVPTSSTAASLAMGDALACALIKIRNFKASDFAQFHPGGSIGKRLLTRVKDVMLSTNLPIVSPAQKISDTIIEISKNKQGIAIALENGNIVNSVNFPTVSCPRSGQMRICIIHQNVPNMISRISAVISNGTVNIENMLNKAKGDFAYTIVDINTAVPAKLEQALMAIDGIIRIRVIA